MSSTLSSTSGSPTPSVSTLPSSPEIQTLSLADAPSLPTSDEDKAAALQLKAEANKAFSSTRYPLT